MNEPRPKAASLTVRTLMPTAAPARPVGGGDERAGRARRGEDDEAEERAGHLPVEPSERCIRAEVQAEQVRLGDRGARRAAPPGRVDEAQLLDSEGGGQRPGP